MTLEEFRKKANKHTYGDHFTREWCVGGTAGSCWGPGLSIVHPSPEEDWNNLHDFLLEVAPGVGLLQYKAILQLVENEDYQDGDYYGGSTFNRKETVSVDKLYHKPVDLGLLK